VAVDKLEAALKAVDWAGNVRAFLSERLANEKLAACNLRLAIWSKQLEQVDKNNPALTFIREMQSAGQMTVALTSLSLYKPAASSIRTVIETALYYSYFRTHHTELATLIRNKEYYIDKSEIINYHKIHTVEFKSYREHLGLLSRLNEIYSVLSAIVHGQLPGVWTTSSALNNTSPNPNNLIEVVQRFVEGEEVVHRLFLCTAAPLFWDDFSTTSKKALLAGLPGETKSLLKLDAS
jgi:hypothetical protein